MLGYRLHNAQAATAEVVFTLGKPPLADVPIDAGRFVRPREVTEPIRFQLLSDLVIPAGAVPPVATGTVEHSKTRTRRFDSKGLADLDIVLDHAPYLDDSSAVVSATNGAYEERDSLLGSGPSDCHYWSWSTSPTALP